MSWVGSRGFSGIPLPGITVEITSKGQVTHPIAIRERPGLLPDTEVELEIVGTAARMWMVRSVGRVGRREKSIVERLRGARRSPLPDFDIGAHAMVSGLALLTRDSARLRTDLPGLESIAPQTERGDTRFKPVFQRRWNCEILRRLG